MTSSAKPSHLRRVIGRVVRVVLILALIAGAVAVPRLLPKKPLKVRATQASVALVRDVVSSATAGEVTPELQATVRAEAGGQVVAVRAKKGDRVKKDQILVELDAKDLQARLRQAQASILVVDAQRGQAQARLQTLVQQQQRATLLAEKGAGTQQLLDDAQAALALAAQCEANFVAVWPRTTLGFLEISLGNYDAAVDVLQPLVAMATAMPMSTEIFVTPFLPDAAEALIQLGRADEAEPLVDALETNGLRLDRPWMLACGGRCRALLLACRGDLGGATTAAQRALVEHDRLPMPFERARTQLVLGQLQRRQRHREQALGVLELRRAEVQIDLAAEVAGLLQRGGHGDDGFLPVARRVQALGHV